MIELKNISKIYDVGNQKIHALDQVDLRIEEGEFVAIMGPSGSGKSTLLNVIGLLDFPDEGIFKLYDKNIYDYNEEEVSQIRSQLIGFIFQQFNLLKRTTAKDNVSLPHLYYKSQTAKTAEEVLEIVALGDRIDHRPNELSGGQQQRVAIARSLINNPKILFADEPTGNLDSKSEAEIFDVLKKLNKQGITIVMVSHEEYVSKIARRVIKMHDGKIISDTGCNTEHNRTNHQLVFDKTEKILEPTFVFKNIQMAMASILANKIRSLLSMLGILIGVAAVIAMLAIGRGAQDSISSEFSSLGTNILTVSPGAERFGPNRSDAGNVTRLTIDDTKAIISKINGVEAATSMVRGQARLIFANKNWSTSVVGGDINYKIVDNANLQLGRFYSQAEDTSRKRLAIIGVTIVKELFGTINPLGKDIKINGSRFQIIGILKEKGSTGFRDQDDIIIIPLNTAMKRLLGKKYISNIKVKVKQDANMDQVESQIKRLIIEKKKITDEENPGFNIRNMASFKNALTNTTKSMSYLLAIISAISLVVGGIGIMNIMLVSVTERTHEIGLRKAIGASKKAILIQFLIESVIISLTGGIIGILCGGIISIIVSLFFHWNTTITVSSVLISTFFSVALGIIFGIWPAKKASEHRPIDALRYE